MGIQEKLHNLQKEKEKLEIRLIEIQEEIPLVEIEIKQNHDFFQQAEQTTEILNEVNKKIEILCENESLLQSQFHKQNVKVKQTSSKQTRSFKISIHPSLWKNFSKKRAGDK